VRHTLVLLKTFFNLGKSEIPASRIAIEESSRLRDDRREETEEESEDMDCDWAGVNCVVVLPYMVFVGWFRREFREVVWYMIAGVCWVFLDARRRDVNIDGRTWGSGSCLSLKRPREQVYM
jgi:hypothetical protein